MSFLKNLTKFPKSAIYGIAFLIAGWAWFFFTLYILFREIPGKILIVGIGIIFLVFAFHLWGIGRGSEALCFAGNIILFGYSGYYLFVKETSDYFKSINEQDKKAEKDA